jgi:proline dehydrogenase
MKELLSSLARRPAVRKTAMSTPGLRNIAWRFVAGESLEAGIDVVRALEARGILATLNYVGTHVHEPAGVVAGADEAIASLRRMREENLDANISVKPTHIGLDIDDATCRTQLLRILDCAQAVGGFVWIDMEESPYVERTIRLFEEMRAIYGDSVGIVLQSYLRSNRGDLERLAAAGARIRICKGGYWEPGPVAYHSKPDIDQAFRADVELLLRRGLRPAIASHDPLLMEDVRRIVADAGLDRSAFELQMLYGVRSDLRDELVREGYTVRCYVPYGSRWYEYVLGCIRRLPGTATRKMADRVRARSAS